MKFECIKMFTITSSATLGLNDIFTWLYLVNVKFRNYPYLSFLSDSALCQASLLELGFWDCLSFLSGRSFNLCSSLLNGSVFMHVARYVLHAQN